MPVIVPSIHLGAFFHSENKLISYADDSTLIAVVPSSYSIRVPEP